MVFESDRPFLARLFAGRSGKTYAAVRFFIR